MFVCKKEGEPQANDNSNLAGISQQQNDDAVERIVNFKKQLAYYKANPNIKDGEKMSLEDAVWNIENTFDATYAFPEDAYAETRTQEFTLHLDVDADGNVLLTDHLGNVRAEFCAHDSGVPELVQQTDYYPFGLALRSDDYGCIRPNRKLYGGKELQDETLAGYTLNWYDFEARMYNPAIGRFLQTDRMQEKYYGTSPYAYCLNNPLKLVDLDGNDVQVFEQKDKKTGMVTVTFFVTMRVENHSQASLEDINDRAVGIKQQIEDSFKGYDKKTNTQYETIVQFVGNSDEQFVLDFVNDVRGGSVFTAGKTDEIGNTIVNTLQVEIDGIPGKYNQTESETSRTGAHEFGHALGLRHGQDPQNELNFDADNLMNQSNKSSCTDITIEQMEAARKNVIKNMER